MLGFFNYGAEKICKFGIFIHLYFYITKQVPYVMPCKFTTGNASLRWLNYHYFNTNLGAK